MEFLKTDESNGVYTICLNRPEARNAFHPEMIRELEKALTAIPKNARVCFIKGEGPSFSAGADLKYMNSMSQFTFRENLADAEYLFDMFQAALDCPVPLVGLVHGHVMGGATGIVACCDYVVAETDTKFSFSEVRLGLAPAVISPFILRRMGERNAMPLMLSAEVFTAEKACSAGLINDFGSMSEIGGKVEAMIAQISANAPEALRATKKLLRGNATAAWHIAREDSVRVIAERRVSEEGQRGLQGFLQKQPVDWTKQ